MNKYSKWIVILIISLNLFFLYYTYCSAKNLGVYPPDSINHGWFAFTASELWVLASIKKTKEIENTKKKRDC